MAKQNAPELFSVLGNEEEEKTHQQHVSAVDPHVAGVSAHGLHMGVGEIHPTLVSHDHIGDPYPGPVSHEVHPAPVSHGPVEEDEGEKKTHEGGNTVKLHKQGHIGQFHHYSMDEDKFHGEYEKKTHEQLHHTNNSPSGEEEDEKGEKKKNKSKLSERHDKAEEEVEKIEEKLPRHHKEEEKGH